LPEGWRHLDVSDVDVDSSDRVYLLTRSDPRVIVYEADGRFVGSWGEDVLSEKPHGLTIGPDDVVYVVDELAHRIHKFTPDGTLLATIGSGTPSATGADPDAGDLYDRLATVRVGGAPFNRPTALAIAPSGELYVTDGYGNARVHRFAPDGELIASWGEPGTGPSEFNLPHAVLVVGDLVMVADRENDRIQLFTLEGRFVEQWVDFHRPAGLARDRQGRIYVAELPWPVGWRTFRHGVVGTREPARITVMDEQGTILDRFGDDPPCAPGNFAQPHGVAVDSRGALYVAEVTYSGAARFGDVPPDCHTFQKLEPI
jgi:DNA-binding beta-propeller fold protein YncE